ncbi:MAG: hypothetical protein ABI678_07700 [Kofleriaceae bacterium]
MKRWVVVAMVGCGAPAKPEPLETPVALERASEVNSLQVAAPKLDLQDYTPDISAYGRWPLSVAEHPELEPHFAIAAALAQPGITWQDLCARGAQQRRMTQNADYGEYLAAWCSVAKDDTRDALFRLGNLHRSFRLRAAIELDAAAIVVANLDGGAVEGELRRANLLELRIVDRISAAYFEIGKVDSAEDLNRLAIQMDATPTTEVLCARRLRKIANGGADAKLELELLSHRPAPKVPGKCEELALELACWTGTQCRTSTYGLLKREAVENLTRARALWPTGYAGFVDWYRVADTAASGWPVEQAYALAVPALELALRTSRCSSLDRVARLATRLATVPDLDASGATLDEAPRVALAPALASRYAPRLSSIVEETRTLPKAHDDWCRARLAGLPAVVVP